MNVRQSALTRRFAKSGFLLELLLLLLLLLFTVIILVEGTSTSARSTGDKSAGWFGRISATGEEAEGGGVCGNPEAGEPVGNQEAQGKREQWEEGEVYGKRKREKFSPKARTEVRMKQTK